MKKIENNFQWKVAGAAGDGILNAGLSMFAKSCLRDGLNVYATAEYPSLIRGGHNHLDVRVSDRKLQSHSKHIDILVALNTESIEKHKRKLNPGGGIIYDGDVIKLEPVHDFRLFPIPLQKLAQEAGGQIMKNTVAIGATMALVDLGLETLNQVIADNFRKKGDAVVQGNIRAARLGYDFAEQNFEEFGYVLTKRERTGEIFLSGNEALSLGAIKAGCKYYAAYPMTPASSILHTMAAFEKQYNIVVKHTEDEIAAINSVIGASFAGVRSMVGTSGGGFALMTEGLGLAAQTETPLVVVEAQRPGPATGMATHSGQGDLRFVLHASTDEFPRLVIAPGDVEECYSLTIEAFRLAEKYQMPVILLTDKYLGESYSTVKAFDSSFTVPRESMIGNEELIHLQSNGGFKRYKITDSGISPRSIPSQKAGQYVASSYEHDEVGFEREEEEIRISMHDKRFRKLEQAAMEIPKPQLIGPGRAEITIISWGSPKGPILEAMGTLEKQGVKANFLQIVYISPFPTEAVTQVMKNARRTVMVENNKTSLMSGLIKEQNGMDIDHTILRYDGRPFNPEDLYEGLAKILEGK